MPLILHPGFGEVLRYEAIQLPDAPDDQVEQTISLMREYAVQDSAHPLVREDAASALRAYPGLSPEEAVFYWVKNRVGFVRDEVLGSPIPVPPDAPLIETLIRPVDMVALCSSSGCRRAGDCDDFSMYGAALLTALGRRVCFVTVAADGRDPNAYSHVYLVSYGDGGERFPLDISHGPHPGWETANLYGKRREWPVGGLGAVDLLLVGAGLWWWFKGRKQAA